MRPRRMDMPEFTGRCACGALTYEFSNAPDFVANC